MDPVHDLPARPTWGPPPWAADGACVDHPHPDWWYGQDDDGHQDRRLLDQAREICRGCPVEQPCLVDALERGDRDGMWGGTTPDERRRVARMARELFADQPQEPAA